VVRAGTHIITGTVTGELHDLDRIHGV